MTRFLRELKLAKIRIEDLAVATGIPYATMKGIVVGNPRHQNTGLSRIRQIMGVLNAPFIYLWDVDFDDIEAAIENYDIALTRLQGKHAQELIKQGKPSPYTRCSECKGHKKV